MKKKYLDNYEIIKSCIKRILDSIYDMLDATEQANISDERTKILKKVSLQYEDLLKKFIAKEELTPFEESEITIIMNQTISEMEIQRKKITKAVNELKKIVKNVT